MELGAVESFAFGNGPFSSVIGAVKFGEFSRGGQKPGFSIHTPLVAPNFVEKPGFLFGHVRQLDAIALLVERRIKFFVTQ